jgi:hypothetical protein
LNDVAFQTAEISLVEQSGTRASRKLEEDLQKETALVLGELTGEFTRRAYEKFLCVVLTDFNRGLHSLSLRAPDADKPVRAAPDCGGGSVGRYAAFLARGCGSNARRNARSIHGREQHGGLGSKSSSNRYPKRESVLAMASASGV